MKRITQIIFISLSMLTTQLSSQQLVTDLTPFTVGSSPVLVNNNANYITFVANSKAFGVGLFVTDSIEGQTKLLATLPANIADARFVNNTVIDTTCYYTIAFETTNQLWKTSVNRPNPVLLRESYNSTTMFGFTQLGNAVYFSTLGSNHELWRTDGTATGTTRLYDFPYSFGRAQFLTPLNNALYFMTNNKLWKSDGTVTGTVILKDTLPDGSSGYPREWAVFKNTIYFSAYTAASGNELWQTDGTVQGTKVFVEIGPGTRSGEPRLLTVAGNKMYFAAYDPDKYRELFVTDGTVAGTKLVKDISSFDANPSNFIAHNNDRSSIVFRLPRTRGAGEEFYSDTYYRYLINWC